MATWPNNTEDINESDLNDVDNINNKGVVNYDTLVPTNQKGEYLKGSLSPFKLTNNVYTNHHSNLSKDEMNEKNIDELGRYWFWIQYQNYLSASIELLDYEGLPDYLSKYEIEYNLKNNGLCGLIKFKGEEKIRVVNIFYETKDYYNQGALPKYVKVNKIDELYPFFKDRKLKVNEDIFILRNNLYLQNCYVLVKRYLFNLEKILYFFEKNNAVSLPKALILTELEQSKETKESWEEVVNSSATFSSFSMDTDFLNALKNNGLKNPFLPITFEDKTRQLVENFNFITEKLKELFGFDTLNLNGKKEKALNQEIDASSSVSNFNLAHLINIRNNDFKIINKYFNFNIKVSKSEQETELSKVANSQKEDDNNA